jgi:hypothetical protein
LSKCVPHKHLSGYHSNLTKNLKYMYKWQTGSGM